MFTIMTSHKGFNCTITTTALAASEGKEFAESAAALGHDTLVRVFKSTGHPGEVLYVTAWSVLGGKVTPHTDVTIPKAHW